MAEWIYKWPAPKSGPDREWRHNRLPLCNSITAIRSILFAGCLSILLSGCVGFPVDKVPQNVRFRSISRLADIAAVYNNNGDSHRGGSRELSCAIFQTCSFPGKPDRVRFRSIPPSNLLCEALSRGRIVASRELVQDRDFRIEGGSLRLISAKAGTFLGEGVAGIEKRSTVLRVTEPGDVVMTQRFSEAGMALLVLPIARVDTMDTVFKRIP